MLSDRISGLSQLRTAGSSRLARRAAATQSRASMSQNRRGVSRSPAAPGCDLVRFAIRFSSAEMAAPGESPMIALYSRQRRPQYLSAIRAAIGAYGHGRRTSLRFDQRPERL